MKRITLVFLSFGLSLALCKCHHPDSQLKAEPLPIEAPDALLAPATMVPVKKAVIVVGGCLVACAEPGQAVSGFLAALVSSDQIAHAATFVDTSRLELDGQALGEKWVRMWREGRTATRQADVNDTLDRLAKPLRSSSIDEIRTSMAAGPRPISVAANEAVYRFEPPSGLAPWTLTLRPRGIEWLVVAIRQD